MDQPQTPDWNHIRAFQATAAHGSFSAAARALGLTQPTLSRQVAALEDELGVTLFERVGRTLLLTEAGRDLRRHSQIMGEAAEALSLSATAQTQSIAGTVKVTASDVSSAYLLHAALERIQVHAPKLKIEVIAADDIRDLMRREADIAIRHVRPEQPDLIARLIGEMDGRFYAAQSYLKRRGMPQSLEDMQSHDFIGLADIDMMRAHYRGLGVNVGPERFRVSSPSGLVGWELMKNGFGILPMVEVVGQATPGIEALLPQMPSFRIPVWLTTHRELHTSARIRLVYDILADELTKLTS